MAISASAGSSQRTAGRKRFTFFPPDQFPNLYVGPLDLAPGGQPTSLVKVSEPDLERYFGFDPTSILTFSQKGRLLGAVAFLYLNWRGHDALIFDEIDLTHPDVGLLAGPSDEASAIYVWAIAGQGRAMAGLGNVSTHLSSPRLKSADLFAAPSSAEGRNLTIALGFEPTPSYQQELWRYQRLWNRFPSLLPAPIVSSRTVPARSFADARH